MKLEIIINISRQKKLSTETFVAWHGNIYGFARLLLLYKWLCAVAGLPTSVRLPGVDRSTTKRPAQINSSHYAGIQLHTQPSPTDSRWYDIERLKADFKAAVPPTSATPPFIEKCRFYNTELHGERFAKVWLLRLWLFFSQTFINLPVKMIFNIIKRRERKIEV